MSVPAEMAPGVPDDYYSRIYDAEREHAWYWGMWAISAVLLGERMGAGARVLDAGCGTGGYLRFLLDRGQFSSAAGTDLAGTAIELARERVPEVDLRVAPLRELPFPDASFELVVSNDVLQHVPDTEVLESLLELRRVLVPDGAILLRTNGSLRFRQERDDWRVYDGTTLRRELENAGFVVERLTFANTVLSVLGAVRGRVPHPPTEEHHGVPTRPSGTVVSAICRTLLAAEARWIGRGGGLPYGHTLFALAAPRGSGAAQGLANPAR